MSNSHVTITVQNGPLKGMTRTFHYSRQCIIGRSSDCDFQLSWPEDSSFANVSRHHCELDIDPPMIHLRDLGSRNGTWLNGQRLKHGGVYLENESDRQPGDFVPLGDGDVLDIGHTRIQITVETTNELMGAVVASSESI